MRTTKITYQAWERDSDTRTTMSTIDGGPDVGIIYDCTTNTLRLDGPLVKATIYRVIWFWAQVEEVSGG